MDPNIILVNVLAAIGVVKAILWLLEDEEAPESDGDMAPRDKDTNNKIKPLRMSKRILGILHDEDDDERGSRSSKSEETDEENECYVPRWIRIIQEEEKTEPPADQRSRRASDEEADEVYLYAICIFVSIILSIIILR